MKPKETITCLIAHTSLRVSSREECYFDSGCLRHITKEKTYLEEWKSYSNSDVTFGDGEKGRTKGMGKLASLGFPCLEDVRLVKGLNSNFTNINQICYQVINVKFNKYESIVTIKE